MLTLKILFVISSVNYINARPGYTSLSHEILSSMTNLWNDEIADPMPDERWRYVNAGNYSVPSEHLKENLQLYRPITKTININPYSEGSKKANEQFYIKAKASAKSFIPENASKQLKSTHIVKSGRNDESPLYDAVYDSQPVSYDRLLHHYDYLDNYQEQPCVGEDLHSSKKEENIEELLSKFLETIKVIVDRPIEVHANVANCDTPIVLAPKPNIDSIATTEAEETYLSTKASTTESSTMSTIYQSTVAPPSYVGNVSSHSRYAEKQADIVKNLKEKYEKLYRLVETLSQSKTPLDDASTTISSNPVSLEASSENSEPPQNDVTTVEPLSQSTTSLEDSSTTISSEPRSVEISSENTGPLQNYVTTIEPTDEHDTTSSEESQSIESTSASDENTSPLNEDTLSTESASPSNENNLPDEGVDIDSVSADASAKSVKHLPILHKSLLTDLKIKKSSLKVAIANPLSRRKRRSIESRDLSKRSLPTLTTAKPIPENISYERFVEDTLGNNTDLLNTLVLNTNPIVEHIHEKILDYEKIKQGEWTPPRKEINCTESTSTEEPLNVEDLMSNPPDFIVNA